MDLSSVVSGRHSKQEQSTINSTILNDKPAHPYPEVTAMSGTSTNGGHGRSSTPTARNSEHQNTAATSAGPAKSPFGSPTPKSVAFMLLFPESPQYRARLPMRVQIFPHDTTESIVTTVKNFYGLYAGPLGAQGVSFEDQDGNTLIARYENLHNNMTVYVRVIGEPSHAPDTYGPQSYQSASPAVQHGYMAGESYGMLPPQHAQALSYGQPPSRPTSAASRKRSVSPNGNRGRRSLSVSTNLPPKKSRSRSGYKSRASSTHGSFADIHSDGMNGYSSGDGAPGSVSSRTKSEHLGNTEISLDNIVEGGRRKRAKFESSELPLFAPPQMPAATSNSSVSPARRIEHQRASFPFTHPAQHPFSYPQLMQSPHGYSNNFGQPEMYSTPGEGRRTRGVPGYSSARHSINETPNVSGSRILPTPDPTIGGSCMSEEDKDVALQLMRLGEMSNISHGRTSASTFADDTFSGRADAASSTGATSESESEDELPQARRQKREPSPILPPGTMKKFGKQLENVLPSQETEPPSDEMDYEDGRDATFKPDMVDDNSHEFFKSKMVKAKSAPQIGKPRPTMNGSKSGKMNKPAKSRSVSSGKSKIKTTATVAGMTAGSRPPISPTSIPSQSRKTSVSSALNFQHQLGDDEEDLSSKPRCQRCRKSKKGCDRQRPCQRCKDAGLSADQCVSEDEGNGRKGRYGRHMGVPVKKEDMLLMADGSYYEEIAAGGSGNMDKSKKRKR